MMWMLDCLVSYFGIDESERPTYRRYFCYQIVAGPGPTDKGGIAVVTTLALHDEIDRCTSCQKFHVVETGGPEAAVAAAVRYLDSYHEQDHLRKVQSDILGLQDHQSIEAPPYVPPVEKLMKRGVVSGESSASSRLATDRLTTHHPPRKG